MEATNTNGRDERGRCLKGYTANPRGNHTHTSLKGLKIKESFYDVFNLKGGTQGLQLWAAKNPSEFYKLLVTMLPKELKGDGFGGTKLIIVRDKGKDERDEGRNRIGAIPEEVSG